MPSSASTPPPSVVFFIDRSLGRFEVATALRAAGLRVEVHDDHFPQDAPDETWLTHAGDREWVVVTRDKRIRYRPLEKQSLINARVRALVMTAAAATGAQTASALIKALPDVLGLLERRQGPWIATISGSSVVRVIED